MDNTLDLFNKQITVINEPADPLSYGYVNYNKHGITDFDMHYSIELGVVCEGQIRKIYQDYQIDLIPGQVWFNGIWEPHGFKVLSAPCSVFYTTVKPEYLMNFNRLDNAHIEWLAPFQTPPKYRPQSSPETRNKILELANSFKTISPKNNIYFFMEFISIYIHLFVTIIKEWKSNSTLKSGLTSYHHIAPAIQLILENNEFITLEKAARACKMSVSSFKMKFKQVMHVTFSKFALQYRVKQSADALLYTAMSIKEISLLHGFNNVSHFYRSFQQQFNDTPFNYRKKRY